MNYIYKKKKHFKNYKQDQATIDGPGIVYM
jgi:hypothetical protein